MQFCPPVNHYFLLKKRDCGAIPLLSVENGSRLRGYIALKRCKENSWFFSTIASLHSVLSLVVLHSFTLSLNLTFPFVWNIIIPFFGSYSGVRKKNCICSEWRTGLDILGREWKINADDVNGKLHVHRFYWSLLYLLFYFLIMFRAWKLAIYFIWLLLR